LVVHGHVFSTLLDTGANLSVAAQQVVDELDLKINPLPGSVKLAHAGATVNRIGRTDPVDVQALFLGSPATTPPSKSFSHAFEVMPLDTAQYSFLLGMDLIQVLFPSGIPSEFYPPALGPSPTIRSFLVDVSPDVVITTDRNLIEGLAEMQREIHNEGIGHVPAEELPERASAYTPAELESQYATERNRLLADPAIVEALDVNSRITGFCNVPESVLRLDMDPDRQHTLYRKQYKIPHSLLPAAREVINRWFTQGIIVLAPPGCEYNNPLTMAPKKNADGVLTGIRVCEDPRAINAAQRSQDKFQLPHIPDILEIFGGCSIFGEFDCEEAYLHFELHPESQPLTAFTFDGTQYMFRGCPFGLSCMPSHFQRNMNYIFKDMPFTYPYLDNLPFASKSWEEHRDHALAIILRCNEVNMKIKLASVNIGQSHLKCLGHLLSVSGIGISPAKAEAIRNWELPATGKQLQSFLGFATFIRRNIRHFADITGPLESIKNNATIEWTETLRECFNTVKEAVAKAPFLQFPDYSLPFHIATDASNVGCGGVLYQPHSPDEDITPNNIVSICSRKWNQAQLNYPAYKKELYGIVYCLRQFHCYVWGRNDLVIFTDHKPLTHVLEQKEMSVALQQWLDVLLDYKFKIQYRPGILNVVPDALSRMFNLSYPQTWGIPLPAVPSSVLTDSASLPPSGAGSSDAITSPSVAFVLVGEGIALASVELEVELEKRGAKAPPESERQDLIKKAHLFGHFGRQSVYRSLLAQGLWWPAMRTQIAEELASCDPCNRFTVVKSGFNPSQFITANGPFDQVQIDTSVHLPKSPDGFTALLVVIDVFTGFVLLRALKDTSAESVAAQLWDIFSTFGLPKILQSDNGSEFVNDTLRALVKLTGIDHRLISPYNPRADGKVERSIGTCMSIIKKLLHGSTQHWPLFVSFAQLSFNHKISFLTGSSPFSLMFGRQLNEFKDYSGDEGKIISLDEWKQHQEKILSLIFPAVSERVRLSKSKMVQALNKTRRTLLHSAFPNGAIVMLKDQLRANKWEPKYVGPYTVVRRTRNGNYVLRDATGDVLDRHTPPDQLKLVSRKARAQDEQESVYEVQQILGHRGSAPNWEYHTKWKGYRETTWEPASSFHDTSLITDYWKNPSAQRVGQ
jgi:transposase InsO family protein